ncbi:MAG: hypothetical protein SGI86_21575 [Deltaproteobacteria bacterium]|nr:hypothetical protein [Deltaproteobacteria bacterium]
MRVSGSFTKLALVGILFGACSGGSSGGGKGGTRGNTAGEGGSGTAGEGAGGNDSGGTAGGEVPMGGEVGTTGGTTGGSGGSKSTGGGGGTTATGGSKTGGAGGTVAVTGGTSGTIPGLGLPCAMDPNCDNFESYGPGSKPGGQFANIRGSLSVETGQAYSGTKAVKVIISGESRMDHRGNGFLPGDKIYMRAMVYFETQPKAAGLHWNFLHAEGGSEGPLSGIFFATGGWGDAKNMILYGAGGGGTYADCSVSGEGTIVANRWRCVEMQMDAVTNSIDVLYDGKPDMLMEVRDAAASYGTGKCLAGNDPAKGKLYIPKITKVAFGPKTWHANPGTVMWMDDIAVSNKPIGCPAK